MHSCAFITVLLTQSLRNDHKPLGDEHMPRVSSAFSVPAPAFFNDFKNEYDAWPSIFYECICSTLTTSVLTVKYALCRTVLSSFESLFVLFFGTDCRVKWLRFQKQKIYTPFSLYYPSTPPVIGAGWKALHLGCHFSCTVHIRVQMTSTPSSFHKPYI